MMLRSTGSSIFSVRLALFLAATMATAMALAAKQPVQAAKQPEPLRDPKSAMLLMPSDDLSPHVLRELSDNNANLDATSRSSLPSKDLTAPLTAMAQEASKDSASAGKDNVVPSVKVDGPVLDVDGTADKAKSSGKSAAQPSDSAGYATSSSSSSKTQVLPSAKTDKTKTAAEKIDLPKIANMKTPEKQVKPLPQSKPQKALSETMTAVRDRVRWVLANYYHTQLFGVSENTPSEILHLCNAYGCKTNVQYENDKINGIAALCWNYPCAGYELLRHVDRHIAPRVGYGLQEQPGQFLAMLAISRVPTDYPVRVGNEKRTVADVLEYEKLQCRADGHQSLRLLGIGHYLTGDESWKDDLGKTWTVERLMKEELSQPVNHSPLGGTQRLFSLSYVLARQRGSGKQGSSEVYAAAEKFLSEFRPFAFRIQNSNGSWHPSYFLAKGTDNDSVAQLRATAHVLQWLAVSQPEASLDDPKMIQAVEYVNSYLINQNNRWNLSAMDAQTIDAVTCALSALTFYDERAFRPYDKMSGE